MVKVNSVLKTFKDFCGEKYVFNKMSEISTQGEPDLGDPGVGRDRRGEGCSGLSRTMASDHNLHNPDICTL